MKITANDGQKKDPSPRRRFEWGRVPGWLRAGLFLALLVAVFAAGAFTYRSGAARSLLKAMRNMVTGGPVDLSASPAIEEVVESVGSEIQMYENNDLPTVYLDLPFESLTALRQKREEALEVGILTSTDADMVPASIRLQDGPTLDADVRLKGDWSDHLGEKKWSMRVHLKEDGSIFGFTRFSLQSPATRRYLREWGMHQNLMQEGVLATGYQFANLLVNGELWGVYAVEESFTTELAAAQGRERGVVVRFDDDILWTNTMKFWLNDAYQESSLTTSNEYNAEIEAFQMNRVMADPVLKEQYETARNLLQGVQKGELKVSDAFDVDLLGRFYALSDLWSACHGVFWHNLRFYYNPVTAKLEPVVNDNEPFQWCDQNNSIVKEFTPSILFDDAEVRAAYARALAKFTQPDYIDNLKASLEADHDRMLPAMQAEFGGEPVEIPWNLLETRRHSLSLELQPAQPVQGAFQLVGFDAAGEPTAQAAVELDVTNLIVLPVELLRLEVGGVTLTAEEGSVMLPYVVDPEQKVYENVRLSFAVPAALGLKASDFAGGNVEIIVRLAGLGEGSEMLVPVVGSSMPDGKVVGPLPEVPTIEEALRRYPFLSYPGEGETMRAAAGVWKVNGDLVLPAGMNLDVEPGTTLRFSEGAILYATGAIWLDGTPSAPVVLTADQESWGGVVVMRAGYESSLHYAVVEKTTGVQRPGWRLAAGATFYESDVVFDHAHLADALAGDLLNVIRSGFTMRDTELVNSAGTAFRSDFSRGEASAVTIRTAGGDGFHAAGSKVTLQDVTVTQVSGRAIAASRKSTVSAAGLELEQVGVGAAAVDGATLTIADSSLNGAAVAGLVAYTRMGVDRSANGPAVLQAENFEMSGVEAPGVCRTGSTLTVDGETIPPASVGDGWWAQWDATP